MTVLYGLTASYMGTEFHFCKFFEKKILRLPEFIIQGILVYPNIGNTGYLYMK